MSQSHIVGIVALLCIFVGAPMVGTGTSFALVALIAVLAAAGIGWRAVQAWTGRLQAQPLPEAAALQAQLQHMEALVDALAKGQAQLQETVRWQGQLLQRAEEQHSELQPPTPGVR